MKMRVYQIDHERDTNRVSFESYEKTIEYAGGIDPSIYNTVFEGEVGCSNLEEIYELFNTCHPVTHQGHSISVSDIVEIMDSVDSGCYYCDSVGFTKLTSFDSQAVQPIQGVRMLVVEPHKQPYEARIKDDFRS
ncbi:MAG: hypothetical protein A2Y17_10480 [Clostridiales bacterium GWF2_38_85]|nr:MAG: hypothetical protein A2Y17_10480 [Clostridiales bacterium GWF2_38_85]